MLRKRLPSSSSSMSQDGDCDSPLQIPMNPLPSSLALEIPLDQSCSPEAATTAAAGTSAPSQTSNGISDWEAGVSLAKAIMGAGSFALPWAFSKMGYIAGPLVLVIFLGLSVRSIGLLVDCARWVRTQQNKRKNLQQSASASATVALGAASRQQSNAVSYVDVARSTFGSTGAALAYAASIASSIGVCGSYLVFVSVNLSALLGMLITTETTRTNLVDKQGERCLFLLLVWTVALPIAVLLSSVRDPKRFAEVSFWGDLSVVAGMLAVVIYGVAFGNNNDNNISNDTRNHNLLAIGSPGDMALALGSIGYLFLVHFLVLPIESSMAGVADVRPPDAETAYSAAATSAYAATAPDRFRKVVSRTFVVCGAIGGVFGIIGYGLFGKDTQQIVLLNVEGSIGMAIVQALLCIDLLLTYPVVMRPSISILEEHWLLLLKRRGEKKEHHFIYPYSDDDDDDGLLQMVALVPATTTTTTSSSPFSMWCNKRCAASASTSALGDLSNQGGGGSSTSTIPPSDGNSQEYNNNHHCHDELYVLGGWNHMAVCIALGVVAAGAGSFVPAFGLLSGLVGGVSQTFLAFVMPPLMWAKQQLQQQQQFQQKDSSNNNGRTRVIIYAESHETNALACFGNLPWSEKALVLCGLGLIGWTLQSTWAELTNKEH